MCKADGNDLTDGNDISVRQNNSPQRPSGQTGRKATDHVVDAISGAVFKKQPNTVGETWHETNRKLQGKRYSQPFSGLKTACFFDHLPEKPFTTRHRTI